MPVSGPNHDAPAFEEAAELRRIVSSLLNAITGRISEHDGGGFEALQQNVRRTAQAIMDVPVSLLLTVARQAIQALDAFGQSEPRAIPEHGSEFRNAAETLSRIAAGVGTCLERSRQRLNVLADRLDEAAEIDVVRALRLRLSECAHSARAEAMLQKTDAEETAAALQQQIAAIQERAVAAGGFSDADPVTGLPSQQAAETALGVLARKPGKRYVVIAVVNRIQPINARFGREVGDQVLRTFKENLERQLVPGDRLFRWTGPALIALLERTEPLEAVRAEVRRLSDASTGNRMIDVGGRQVMITVAAGWSVFMLIQPVTTAFRQIQTFIASQGNRDYA